MKLCILVALLLLVLPFGKTAIWPQLVRKERKQLSGGNVRTGQSGCLVPLCYVYWSRASRGLHIIEWGYGPRLTDLISLVFWYAFAFYSSHPHRRRGPLSRTGLPSPFPVVAFQCKGLDEWLQLAHQKASPAKGPW